MTTYLVLKKTPDALADGEWSEVGTFDGNTGQSAVRAAILATPEADREKASAETFAATPVSSWQLFAPKVSVETKVAF